jgi:hypothetical protein
VVDPLSVLALTVTAHAPEGDLCLVDLVDEEP